jgi:hypothetical protein
MQLLDFRQKAFLNTGNFRMDRYLNVNGLYRYNTLFFLHLLPKRGRDRIDDGETADQVETSNYNAPLNPPTRSDTVSKFKLLKIIIFL